MIGLALLKVRRQLFATLLIAAMVTSSNLAFILIPSLSTNLGKGLSGYSNEAATYIVVQPGWIGNVQSCIFGGPTCGLLPTQLVGRIISLPGVERTYAAVVNVVWLHYKTCGNGNCLSNATESEQEFVCGVLGNGSYPSSLVALSLGRLPHEGAPEFVMLSSLTRGEGISYTLGHNYTFHLNLQSRNFSSTLVGIEQLNPLLSGTGVFFDAAFMKNTLGPDFYEQAFGGNGSNLIILKAVKTGDVQPIVNSLNRLLANQSDFGVVYDLATITNLQTFETQTAPLYLFLSVVAMVSATAATLFVFYMGVGRREWEVGLLVSQGWSWGNLTKYFTYYYLPITATGWAVATILSYLIGPWVAFGFAVYGTSLVISANPVLTFVLLGLVVMLVLAFASSWLAIHRLQKKGLDELLREI